MKAISLWQPWACWVSHGFKTIETRTHTRFKNLKGQRIAIHASKKFDPNFRQGHKWLFKNNNPIKIMAAAMDSFFGGRIVCTAYVYDFKPLNRLHSKSALIDCANTKRYGLFLKDVTRLEKPIYCKGHQGIFNVEI